MNNQRKLSFVIIVALIISLLSFVDVSALKIGDKLGDVLHSDISAYINGDEISCYNIDSKIVVIVSDLKNYGFDTKWDSKSRTTLITLNTKKNTSPLKVEHSNQKVGSVAFPYVYTDIQAFVDGNKVDSYNVKGDLCIGLRDLSVYGSYVWEGKARTVSLTTLTETDKAATALEAIIDRGTIRELNNFISEWGNKSDTRDLTTRAATRIEELKSDSRVSNAILNRPNEATTSMIEEFLREYPGHKDEQKIRALDSGELMDLIKTGTVVVAVSGNSISFTSVKLTNKASRSITVTIPVGTYFSSQSSSVQNMAVRASKTVTISVNSSTTVDIATACMNINRDIPTSKNTFTASALEVNSKLLRVVKLLEQKNASYAVAQAAIWIVTDNPDDYTLLNTLVDSYGRSVISSSDLSKAKEIVREAR